MFKLPPRFLIGFICKIAPQWVVAKAYDYITNPQIHKLRSYEIEILNKALQETLSFKGFEIAVYTWNAKPDPLKTVLLIHGWEGQAGNFADIIQALVQEDYTVYAFDAPSHGLSSKGKTSIFAFAESVGVMIKKFNAKLLISHSFGSVATTASLAQNPDLSVEKYVLLTTPNKFRERIQAVVDLLGISQNVRDRLILKLEQDIGLDISSLSVSHFVKKINVKQALILHDIDDKIIPIEQARAVAQEWENAKLLEISGTGHFKILRSQEVMHNVINFLK